MKTDCFCTKFSDVETKSRRFRMRTLEEGTHFCFISLRNVETKQQIARALRAPKRGSQLRFTPVLERLSLAPNVHLQLQSEFSLSSLQVELKSSESQLQVMFRIQGSSSSSSFWTQRVHPPVAQSNVSSFHRLLPSTLTKRVPFRELDIFLREENSIVILPHVVF